MAKSLFMHNRKWFLIVGLNSSLVDLKWMFCVKII